MSKLNYTITELTKELNQAKHNIRRRIEILSIKAINEDNRAYKTEPLKYDHQALNILAKDFGIEISYNNSNNNSNNKVKGVMPNVQADIRLIEQLQDDLKHERERSSNLEKLLSQQQQLSFIDKNKIEFLELELKEVKISEENSSVKESNLIKNETQKTKWYNVFNKRK